MTRDIKILNFFFVRLFYAKRDAKFEDNPILSSGSGDMEKVLVPGGGNGFSNLCLVG